MSHFKKQAAAVGFLIFAALWVGGTLHGMDVPFPEPTPFLFSAPSSSDARSNYLMANNIKQIGLADTPLPIVLDQPAADGIRIFEKRARLTARSSSFEVDAVQVRAVVAEHKAAVLQEKSGGIEPERHIHMEISVPPDAFDGLLSRLKSIGVLHSIDVQQSDRTTDFRKLNAQRQSLKKYLESILKLRGGNNPTIDDALKLEQKIKDIERDLQDVGVQLGDFLGKESYYQIDIAMREFQSGGKLDPTFNWSKRIFHGFAWAVAWWFAAMAVITLIAGTLASVWILWPKAKKPG
jgi:hypothetical protein